MRCQRWVAGVLLLASAALAQARNAYYPAAFEQNPEIAVDMPAGTTTFALPDAVGASYLGSTATTTWSTERRVESSFQVPLDRTPNNAFDNTGAPQSLINYPLSDAQGTRQTWFAVVQARQQGGSVVELLVGRDLNDDGWPQAGEELCRVVADPYDTPRCLLDLRGEADHALWAFARVITLSSASSYTADVTLSMSTADFLVRGNEISAATSKDFQSVRRAGSSSAPVPLDFSYRPTPERTTDEPFVAIAGLLITGSNQALPTVFPLHVEVVPTVRNGQGHALAARYDAFEEVQVILQPGETNNALYVDNPWQEALELVVLEPRALVTGWQEAFPPSSLDSRITAVEPRPDLLPFSVWSGVALGAPSYLRVCSSCPGAARRLVPGRVRFSVRNTDLTAAISARIRLRVSPSFDFSLRRGLNAPSGNYYNPLRSGEGLFFDRVDQRLVFYWYTFDQAGQPVWYTALAQPRTDSEAPGTINATLYRIEQHGSRTTTPVGRIILTEANASRTELIFSWSIDGVQGTNRLHWAYAPRCTRQLPSTQLNITGHWFDFSAPGWGTNLLGLRDGIAEGLYFFDADGMPRWVFGQLAQGSMAWSGALFQFQGACPTCSYVAPSLTAVGNASIVFSSDSNANVAYAVNLAAPLHGGFTQTAATTAARHHRGDVQHATLTVRNA